MVGLRLILVGVGAKVVIEKAELCHHVEVVLSDGDLLLHASSITQHVLNGFRALVARTGLFALLLEVI